MPRCVQCCHQMQNGYQAYCHSLVFTQLENLILKELRLDDVFRPPRRKLKSELRWSLLRRRPFFLHDDDLSNQLCMMVSTTKAQAPPPDAAGGSKRKGGDHAMRFSKLTFFITPLAQFDLPDSKRTFPSSSKVGHNFLDIRLYSRDRVEVQNAK